MNPAVATDTARRLPGGPQLAPHRAPYEYYPTDAAATRAFLAAETFDGSIHECAAGEHWMAKEIKAAGYDCFTSDIADYGVGDPLIDFLDMRLPRTKNYMTNPPYGDGLADRFVRKALEMIELTGGKAAMLLNLASLANRDRHAVRVYILDHLECFPQGNPDLATRWTRDHKYAWCVWQSEPTQSTELKWLTTAPYTDAALRAAKRQLKQQGRQVS